MTPFTQINFTHSTLCITVAQTLQIWSAASDTCYDYNGGASLCTHEQVRRACRAGYALTQWGWLADRVGDNQAVVVNNTTCSDFDGVYDTLSYSEHPYCCLEWMKY